jgi:hypothetical protein
LNDDDLSIECERADEIERAGFIHERMIQSIADSDVAIVDITAANPNVYYELGIRHALRDRVTVLIRRKGTQNPFNIAGLSTIEYDETKPEPARESIGQYVRNGLLSGVRDSLVYAVMPGLRAGRDSPAITDGDVEEYAIPGVPDRCIGIVSGNLRHTNLSAKLFEQPIDIWLSSENINMEMARPYDASLSGLIRYLGATKDETGAITEDTIARALRAKMGRRQLVNPGEVVPTTAGQLTSTHKVKRIFHAAAVYGVVGVGYTPIAQVEQCITNALARIDFETRTGTRGREAPVAQDAESILFPLLGTGTARAEVIASARKQLQAAISYLRSRKQFTRVKRVYFLAPTVAHRAGLRVALAELGVTQRITAPTTTPLTTSVPSDDRRPPASPPVEIATARRSRSRTRTRRGR